METRTKNAILANYMGYKMYTVFGAKAPRQTREGISNLYYETWHRYPSEFWLSMQRHLPDYNRDAGLLMGVLAKFLSTKRVNFEGQEPDYPSFSTLGLKGQGFMVRLDGHSLVIRQKIHESIYEALVKTIKQDTDAGNNQD